MVLGRTIFVVFCSPQDLRFCSAQPGLCHICHSFPRSCRRHSWTHAAGDPVSASLPASGNFPGCGVELKSWRNWSFEGFEGQHLPLEAFSSNCLAQLPPRPGGEELWQSPKVPQGGYPTPCPAFCFPLQPQGFCLMWLQPDSSSKSSRTPLNPRCSGCMYTQSLWKSRGKGWGCFWRGFPLSYAVNMGLGATYKAAGTPLWGCSNVTPHLTCCMTFLSSIFVLQWRNSISRTKDI